MNKTIHFDNYKGLFIDLKNTVQVTERRILESDDFFVSNANFFTKSFIVIMCAYLESYLKDVLMIVIDEMNSRLNENCVPYNLIRWSLSPDKRQLKDNEMRFENLSIRIRKEDIEVSGNPFKTQNLFNNFGINLGQDAIFLEQKIKLNTIISKRNNIVHHNDEASDISPNDIREYIDFFISYLENIDKLVINHIKS